MPSMLKRQLWAGCWSKLMQEVRGGGEWGGGDAAFDGTRFFLTDLHLIPPHTIEVEHEDYVL